MPLWVAFLARVSENMFIVGSIGSFAVLAHSSIEDVETLFGLDREEDAS
jgi:hypothetical protein